VQEDVAEIKRQLKPKNIKVMAEEIATLAIEA